ncbi:hypothetical protein Bbelb_260100 [Branchiostoma belcheri]|nr:hypothetical protein Bbelb_260100 [Branchiostoma belcheri]
MAKDPVSTRIFLQNGATVDIVNSEAAEAGYLNVVKVLVRAGADINTKAPVTDLTPLDMAVHARKQDVVNYLVTEAAERRRLQVTKKRTKERQRPKRDSPSVEEDEDNVSSQQTVTPVEETVEGAVGGIQQLNIKDEDSSDKE